MQQLWKYSLALAILLMGLGRAHAEPQDFVGVWANENPNADGVVWIVIDSNLLATYFVQCSPNPCRLSTVPLATFGEGRDNPDHLRALHGVLLSFKYINSVLNVTGSDRLHVEEFHGYTDNSGRQNFWTSNSFRRLSPDEVENLTYQDGEPAD